MGLQKQKGSSLVEVMVALFVLAIGLLGVLAMQTKSMKFNQSAYTYGQAVYLANSIAERIRANMDSAASYTGNIPTAEPNNCSVDAINSLACTQLVNWDLYSWNQSLQERLPGGKGEIDTVTYNNRNFLKIAVSFDDSRSAGETSDQAAQATAATNVTQTYSLLVEYTDIGVDLFVPPPPEETPGGGGTI